MPSLVWLHSLIIAVVVPLVVWTTLSPVQGSVGSAYFFNEQCDKLGAILAAPGFSYRVPTLICPKPRFCVCVKNKSDMDRTVIKAIPVRQIKERRRKEGTLDRAPNCNDGGAPSG